MSSDWSFIRSSGEGEWPSRVRVGRLTLHSVRSMTFGRESKADICLDSRCKHGESSTTEQKTSTHQSQVSRTHQSLRRISQSNSDNELDSLS